MNVLMTYRLQVFETEILPQFTKFKNDSITFIVQSKYSKNWLPILISRFDLELKINIVTIEEFLEGDFKLKFDYEVGNPPYQGTGKADKIWDAIISKCFDLLKENGEMNMIHPGTWRFGFEKSNKNVKRINEIYRKYNLIKLETHDVIDGKETFGVSTDYDIVHLIKEPSKNKTRYISKNENRVLDLDKYELIPTNNIDLFDKLKSNDGDNIQVLYDSDYHHRNGTVAKSPWMSDKKTNDFKYPCIYTMHKNNDITFWYSNKKRGHFGIPKLILKKGAEGSILDINGEYGMCEFAFGILDTPLNLLKIQKAISSEKFKKLKMFFIGAPMSNSATDYHGHMIKFLKEFKKDFWKEFYTPEMEQELITEGKLDKEGNLILL